MKRIKQIALVLIFIGVWSCGNDDDGLLDAEFVPPKTLAEAASEDDVRIQEYLKTHFYNYEEFAQPDGQFDFKIKFDTIAGENSDKVSIFDSGQLNNVEFLTETISVESGDDEIVEHVLYILVARQGSSSESPTIGDNVVLQYEGLQLNNTNNVLNKTLTSFDASFFQPVVFNLSSVVRGFGNGTEYFRTGIGPIDNGDGTVSYDNFGVGAIFMPSGIGYFSGRGPSGTIPAYSPLVFKVDALDFEKDTDFDGDGIPSILEDLDGDGNLNNDNTDADTEPVQVFLPNHSDTDDDDDGIPTIEEIELDAEGNFVGFKDTDGDGVFDHLDNDN